MEEIVGSPGDDITAPEQEEVEKEDERSSDPSDFLEDDGVDVVGIGLRQVVAQFAVADEPSEGIAVGQSHVCVNDLRIIPVHVLFPERLGVTPEQTAFPGVGSVDRSQAYGFDSLFAATFRIDMQPVEGSDAQSAGNGNDHERAPKVSPGHLSDEHEEERRQSDDDGTGKVLGRHEEAGEGHRDQKQQVAFERCVVSEVRAQTLIPDVVPGDEHCRQHNGPNLDELDRLDAQDVAMGSFHAVAQKRQQHHENHSQSVDQETPSRESLASHILGDNDDAESDEDVADVTESGVGGRRRFVGKRRRRTVHFHNRNEDEDEVDAPQHTVAPHH